MKQGSQAIAELAKHLVKLFLSFMINLNIFFLHSIWEATMLNCFMKYMEQYYCINQLSWVCVKGFEFTQFSTADDFNSQMLQQCFLWP